MSTVIVGPVGGVGIVHESDFELRTEPWMVERWTGSREVEPPVVIRHTLGTVSLTDAELVYDGSPWSRYFLDSRGRQLVHFAEAGRPCPDQLLVTVRPGYSYELLYRAIPSAPVMQSARDLPILTLALAERGNALLVHACAFLLSPGAGVLCPGLSGAGKSTLARTLGKAIPPVEVLSDDRVVLSDRAGELRVWGTPWPGDAFSASEGDALLRTVVFLGRRKDRVLRAVSPTEAARRLFAVVGTPFWDRAAMEHGLATIDRLVSSVPLFEASYEPTPGAAEWLLRALESEVAINV